MRSELRSRPMRLAAQLRSDLDTNGLERRFAEASVAVRLEEHLRTVPDARTTFVAIVNQVLRFCPNLVVIVDDEELQRTAQEQAEAIHGSDASVESDHSGGTSVPSAVVNVGVEIGRDPSWTTVNSSGWVARVASGKADRRSLTWSPAPANALGALAAACLAAGGAFLTVAGVPRRRWLLELSLFEGRCGRPGELRAGPPLPVRPSEIDALLVGCGGVANGWADAMRRLPVTGRLGAVDRQALRFENVGPYVLAKLGDLGRPKAEIIADALAPTIDVIPYPEEFELFKLRLQFGLALPLLVVGGLDDVQTRHSVQRLWPRFLIDMGAGGTTSQVLVHREGSGGQCLLRALTRPPKEPNYADRVASVTGLRPERILGGPTTPITAADVAAAPLELRGELESARVRGQLLCGRIGERNLFGEEASDDFAPAAPFVSALAGTFGAAETMKSLTGQGSPGGLHQQFDFLGARGRRLVMRCPPSCECQGRLEHEGASA